MEWICVIFISVFFFFKQKTAYEMRISDWSSDVCSSDLKIAVLQFHRARILIGHAEIGELRRCDDLHSWRDLLRAAKGLSDKRPAHEIGGASCRERVCQYV